MFFFYIKKVAQEFLIGDCIKAEPPSSEKGTKMPNYGFWVEFLCIFGSYWRNYRILITNKKFIFTAN